MAYQKLQAGGALAVIPSDFINIVSPSDFVGSGTCTTTGGNTLTATASTVLFDNIAVKVGDIIHFDLTGTPEAMRITGITSTTVLTVDNGSGGAVTNAATKSFNIYKDNNQACVLYVGTTGNLTLKMAGDTGRNSVKIKSAAVGYHPLQVIRVAATGTTATDIVALW
jgi:hypothetical protein